MYIFAPLSAALSGKNSPQKPRHLIQWLGVRKLLFTGLVAIYFDILGSEATVRLINVACS
jgi:hypothetical protein